MLTIDNLSNAIDGKAIDTMARTYLQPEGLTFVIVGDRRQVEPQLKTLGLPVEIVPALGGAQAPAAD